MKTDQLNPYLLLCFGYYTKCGDRIFHQTAELAGESQLRARFLMRK
ncbi:hypothetical protein B425_1147 [Bacillus amyloliquefaciens]|nr:hypothetical protein B425_1147 [Bacillus amyloliquefaciens]